jgi:aspartate kinase
MFDELAMLADALNTLGDLTPRSLDAIASLGEQISSVLVVAAFKLRGLPAVHVDARHVVITDDGFTRAEPQPDAIAEASPAILMPILREGSIPVMGGYIGSAKSNGVTTTLGRGGSDYSASLVGAALQADAIEIWTDVDGMLTCDPRVVKGSQLIERSPSTRRRSSPRSAPRCCTRTRSRRGHEGIPVWILNSRRPEAREPSSRSMRPTSRHRHRRQERREPREGAQRAACSSPKGSCAAVRRLRATQDVGRRRRDVGGQCVGHDRRRIAPRCPHDRPALSTAT